MPDRSDHDILLSIQELLNGREWEFDADIVDDIVSILREGGHSIIGGRDEK